MRTMVAFLCTLSNPAFALSPAEILQSNQRSVVYLEYKGPSGEVLERATGFLVSHDGFVLTAAHVKPDEDGKMWAVVGQKAGTSFPLTIRGADKDADIAVWQFPQSSSCRPAVTISAKKVAVTDKVLALGFPSNSGLTPNALTVTNLITDSGNWKTDGFLAPGNSGGPIFDEDGKAVAIVHGGGQAGTENNEIIPIGLATPLLQKLGVSAGIGEQVPYDNSCYSTCRNAAHGIERYEVTISWRASSGWMDGGHNPTDECNIVAGGQKQKYQADSVTVRPLPEEREKDILGHVSYKYHCEGEALKGPIYVEKQSPACPLWN